MARIAATEAKLMTPSTTVPHLSSVTIRPATDDDLAAIESLLTSSDLPIAGVKEALSAEMGIGVTK